MKDSKEKIKYKEDLVKEVRADFDARRQARRGIEAKWMLNLNFMLGNQYCSLGGASGIMDCNRQYDWEEREVYNHIAPVIENRLAKFTRINCSVNVRPASDKDCDINVAKLAAKLIDNAQADNGFVGLSSLANYWSEVTGTSFYKIAWNGSKKGDKGGVSITVCPPYEIYPDTLGATGIEKCRSIIHARAYPVDMVENLWGKKVMGGDVSVINMAVDAGGSTSKCFKLTSESRSNHVIVIERYEMPTAEYPEGRLVIVAEDELLYEGILPYVNGANGKRGFPFVRQVALENPAGFYGISIIERLIPVQRAYNTVKNKKHELLNRLASGVLAVEDGSVDVESLEEDGLAPGKIITYRQGAQPPFMMNPGSVPSEFKDEEDRLLAEFVSISGVSDYTANIDANTASGYALSLIIEQDYAKLSVTTESIRFAVKELSKQILRLYRQFAAPEKIMEIGDAGEPEVIAFLASNLMADDIIMEADSEMVETPAVRRSMVFDLLKNGLLGDENGKISNRNRARIMEMLGFGNWESARRTEEIHIKKAARENMVLAVGDDPGIEELDDHEIHVEEHARFLVSGSEELSQEAKDAINAHVKIHKAFMANK